MTLRPDDVTLLESNEFYKALFEENGEIAKRLEERNNGRPSNSVSDIDGLCYLSCEKKQLHFDGEKEEYVCINKTCSPGTVVQEKTFEIRRKYQELTRPEIEEVLEILS